jgi:hypothetical protein
MLFDLVLIIFSYLKNDVYKCLKLLESTEEIPLFLRLSAEYAENWFDYSINIPNYKIFTPKSNSVKGSIGILLKGGKIRVKRVTGYYISNFAMYAKLEISEEEIYHKSKLRKLITLIPSISLDDLKKIFDC